MDTEKYETKMNGYGSGSETHETDGSLFKGVLIGAVVSAPVWVLLVWILCK